MIDWLRSLLDNGDKAEREKVRAKVEVVLDDALIEMQASKEARKNGILADYIEAEKGIKGRP